MLLSRTYNIPSKHPDWDVAVRQCAQQASFWNRVNYILRGLRFGSRLDPDVLVGDTLDYLIDNPWIDPRTLPSLYGLASTVPGYSDGNTKVACQTIAQLAEAWKSADATNATPPGYKHTGYTTVRVPLQAISSTGLKAGVCKPAGWSTGVALGELPGKVKQCLIVPRAHRLNPDDRHTVTQITVVVQYEDNTAYEQVSGSTIAGLDLGVSNLGTLVFDDFSTPMLFSGGAVKSVNQWANKTAAKLQSLLPAGQKSSAQLDKLWARRHRKINHLLHTISNRIVEQLVFKRVHRLVVGYEPGFQAAVNLGKVNNQSFVNIPFGKLLNMLKYKCARYGIVVDTTEESYTSKASFLDGDTLPTLGQKPEGWSPSGKRVKRGLYRSAAGRTINADVNGAYNIIRKVIPTFAPPVLTTDSGCGVHPVRVNLFNRQALRTSSVDTFLQN